jgi:hypothetical protein
MSQRQQSESPSDDPCFGERRSDPRVAVDLSCRALVGRVPRRYRVVDFSCGGAHIEQGCQPPPSAVHTNLFDDGTNRGLHVLARTVWSSDERHAVCFLALNETDRLEVAEGIDRMLAARQRNAW